MIKKVKISSLSDTELVTEMFKNWAGAVKVGYVGLSNNPQAVKLDNACYLRFGEKWYDVIWKDILEEYDHVYDKYSNAHPGMFSSKINIFKSGNEITNEMIPWIEKYMLKF